MNKNLTVTFVVMTVLMTVCLIASNLFTVKVWNFFGLSLTGDLLIFPISYIVNDCISEVYGYRKTTLAIWLAFAANFFFVFVAQAVIALPAAPFWEGSEHFDFVFRMELTVALASMAAFFVGSTVNAIVMSKMKTLTHGRLFWLRAIASSMAGDLADSILFMSIVFYSVGFSKLVLMICGQVFAKVTYEIIVLPFTQWIVKKVKKMDETDVYDEGISYNPFSIFRR